MSRSTNVYPDLDCAVEGCTQLVTHSARYKDRSNYKGPGVPVCTAHYHRWRNYGDVAAADRRPSGVTHGTISCYQSGCHCDDCREVARRKRQHYRSRKRTEGPHICQFCPDRFATSRARYQHENVHGR